MEIDKITVAGFCLAALVVSLFVFMSFQTAFPTLQYSSDTSHYLEVQSDIGHGYSRFLWEYRNADVIAQAFVMFTAAVSCLAIFRAAKGGEEK